MSASLSLFVPVVSEERWLKIGRPAEFLQPGAATDIIDINSRSSMSGCADMFMSLERRFYWASMLQSFLHAGFLKGSITS
jgi:hypothetical protein